MQLPLFPADIYLLPNGICKLQIYEQRYLRLVKIATANHYGFGLCMKIDDNFCHFGTRVIIIDFDPLPNGFMSITIQGTEMFLINNHWRDYDHLYIGDTSPVPNWHSKNITDIDQTISDNLKQLFQQYPEHASYYPHPKFDDITWVCQRWLEVLPLEVNQRQWFMSRNDCSAALSFLHTVISNHSSSE